MPIDAVALLAAALGFVFICGMNDGATVIAIALRAPSVPPWTALVILSGAVAVAPLLVGTSVATTLAADLVRFDAAGSDRAAVFAALVVATMVVAVLAHHGLPTSVAMALVGGLVGAGIGTGRAPDWPTLGLVLAVAAASPLAGGAVAWALSRVSLLAFEGLRVPPRLRVAQPAAFGMLSFAYGANGGQKMLAVTALGLGFEGTSVDPRPGALLLVTAAFTVGLLVSLRRIARSVGSGVMAVRATHAVNSELAAAVAVLGSTAFAVPVSVTQTTTGALVGSGMSERRQIRWAHAASIAVAWLLTLPSAVVLGAGGAWLTTNVGTWHW